MHASVQRDGDHRRGATGDGLVFSRLGTKCHHKGCSVGGRDFRSRAGVRWCEPSACNRQVRPIWSRRTDTAWPHARGRPGGYGERATAEVARGAQGHQGLCIHLYGGRSCDARSSSPWTNGKRAVVGSAPREHCARWRMDRNAPPRIGPAHQSVDARVRAIVSWRRAILSASIPI